ncbi:hypothetical protein D3C76_1159800 [compost metagenome]
MILSRYSFEIVPDLSPGSTPDATTPTPKPTQTPTPTPSSGTGGTTGGGGGGGNPVTPTPTNPGTSTPEPSNPTPTPIPEILMYTRKADGQMITLNNQTFFNPVENIIPGWSRKEPIIIKNNSGDSINYKILMGGEIFKTPFKDQMRVSLFQDNVSLTDTLLDNINEGKIYNGSLGPWKSDEFLFELRLPNTESNQNDLKSLKSDFNISIIKN